VHSQQKQGFRWDIYLAFSVLMSVVYVYIFGYQFNTGDLAEHLPQIYQHFDRELFPKDFFLINYQSTFTVRHYWVLFVNTLSYVLPIDWVCFLLHVVCITLTMLAWMYISMHFSKSQLAPFLTVLIVFFLGKNITIGGNQLLGVAFVGSIPAEMLASWAIYFFLKSNYAISAVLCGISVLFQALVGLHIAIILGAILLINKEVRQPLWMFGFFFLVCASPMLGPLIYKYFWVKDLYDTKLYYKILYEYRAFLHYLPSLFPFADYIMFVIFISVSMFIYYKYSNQNWFVIKFMLVGIILMLIYTLLIEWIGVLAIGKLQIFKITVWLNALCGLMLADIFSKQLLSKFQFNIPSKMYLYAVALVFLLAITNSKYIPELIPKRSYIIGNYEKTSLQVVHEWVKNNTPKSVVFLVPPNNESFSCEAQRSTPVNYKAVVHEPFYMIEWLNRMENYYQVNPDELKGQKMIEQAIFQYNNMLQYPTNHECTYRLDDKNGSNILDKLGETVYEHDNWIITRINE